jgi:hypothetical protein
MKQALLIFPDVKTMSEFILLHTVSNVEANTAHCSLSGLFTDEYIVIAETQYGASTILKPLVDVFDTGMLGTRIS